MYRSCILFITLYSFQLWFYNKVLLSYSLKELNKIQRRAAICILGTFCIFSSFSIEVITGLILIHLHLCKLSGRAQLRAYLLPHNHILYSLLESRSFICQYLHCLFLDLLSHCQRKIIKDPIIDMDNRFNKVFPLFDHLNKEFSPGSCIIDIFPSHFSFHSYNKHSNDNLEACS